MSEWLTGLFWWFLILSVLVPMVVHTDMPPELGRLMELYP